MNTRLDVPTTANLETGEIRSDRVVILTRKHDDKKREKAKTLYANYCPFCGKKYKEEEESTC